MELPDGDTKSYRNAERNETNERPATVFVSVAYGAIYRLLGITYAHKTTAGPSLLIKRRGLFFLKES